MLSIHINVNKYTTFCTILNDFQVFLNIQDAWRSILKACRGRIWIPCVYYEIARHAYFLHVYTARSPILNMQILLKRADSKMKGCNSRLIIGFSDVSGGMLSTSSDEAPPHRTDLPMLVFRCVQMCEVSLTEIHAQARDTYSRSERT